MLHYSNASSRGKNRRYLVIKGGACLVHLAREGFVVDVVYHRGIGSGLGVYRGRRGGKKQYIQSQQSITNKTRQYAVLGVPERGSR